MPSVKGNDLILAIRMCEFAVAYRVNRALWSVSSETILREVWKRPRLGVLEYCRTHQSRICRLPQPS